MIWRVHPGSYFLPDFSISRLILEGEIRGSLQRMRMAGILGLMCWVILVSHASGQAEDLYKAHCSSCHGLDIAAQRQRGRKWG